MRVVEKGFDHSSGRHLYRRLNRGGDRQANAALHRIVQTRLRYDPRTQDYYARRIKVFNLVRPVPVESRA